jgi:serine/threonine protein kinase
MRNSSCSHENIYLNNNYNNYINFNYIDKNYNINNINIQNRLLSIKPNKKSSQKIIYKKINNGLINQRNEKNDFLDLLHLKSKQNNNNNISTSQSKEEISNSNIYNLSISTTKDKSFYISEREKLSSYIKNYFKEKGHYPKSSPNFYKYGRLLGKGAFGKVNLALHIASGKLVAIKSFNKKKLLSEHSKQKIKTEIDILKKLKNSNFFTKIYDTFQTETHILIVMEFICADLLGFIRKREKLSEKISKIIFIQIIQGLKYMHKFNIVHRDIKLDNLLLDLSNTIKICDFGVSKVLKSPDEIMYDQCGTPAYIAPEVFGNSGYKGFSCDIWSLGVTLYYMLKGEQPFKGKNLEELKKNIFGQKYNKIEFISEEAGDLLDKMLKKNPEERITLDEIFNHKWIKGLDICHKNKIKFFSESEKYLLGKYNICYLNNTTEDLIENFEKDDLITSLETDEKKGNTKSIILAPYNTGISFFNDSYDSNKEIYKEIKIENNICKYKGEAQISNMKYEMSNNDEFDNGIIKTRKSNTLTSFSSFSQQNKNNKEKSITLSFDDKDKNFLGKKFLNMEIIEDIEKNIGYDRKYLIQCLEDDEVNYATATYYLMLKDIKDKNEAL